MKLEPGKYYRTRDGRKAYVTGILPFQIEKIYRADGLVTMPGGEWANLAWTEWGHAGGNSNDHLDLVSEWTEPEEVEITIYRATGGNIFVYQGEPFKGQENDFEVVKRLKVTID